MESNSNEAKHSEPLTSDSVEIFEGADLRHTGMKSPDSVVPVAKVLANLTQQNPSVYNRVLGETEAPFPETDGDAFDRQRCVKGFNQRLIEEQVVLCLGVGGVGCSVAMALVRMGVKHLILVDYDIIEPSNLNRQMLFSVNDVGKLKASAAKESLLKNHNIRTTIEAHNFDVVKTFGHVVSLAKSRNVTVVFNNVDYGSTFDMVACALAKSLRVPYVAGSTYSAIAEIMLVKETVDSACFLCRDSVTDSFTVSDEEFAEHILPVIESLQHSSDATAEKLLSASSDNGLEKSVVNDETVELEKEVEDYLLERKSASTSAATSSAIDLTSLTAATALFKPLSKLRGMHGEFALRLFRKVLACPEAEAFLSAPTSAKAFNSGVLALYKDTVIYLTAPHRIMKRRSLRYLPRPRVFYARNVGSWTCVCAGGSLLLVNQWVQYLMSKNKKAVAEWTQLNISCDTGGLETVAFVTEQEKDCPHCRANRELSAPAPV